MVKGKTKLAWAVLSSTDKNKQISKQQSSSNKLSLKRIDNKKEMIAEFPLMYTFILPSKNSQGQQVMSIPIYMKDKLHFTPGFCLADQLTAKYRAEQKALYQSRLSSQSQMIDVENIRQAKPSSWNSYCTICKVRFEDYKEHLFLEEHLKKMRSSPFCKQIAEMAQKKRIQRQIRINNENDKHDKAETTFEYSINESFTSKKVYNKFYSEKTEQLYKKVNQQFLKCKVVPNHNLQCEFNDNIFDVLC